MKKLFTVLVAAVCSMLMMAQTQQITWVNGRALMGQSIESIDSLKYGTMTDADQLVLWLPKTIVLHDTIKIPMYDTVKIFLHDTVKIPVYDTVKILVHDTVIVRKYPEVPEGLKMVDLGLSSGLKWANMNVGATVPEMYGDYFAWGEIDPKDNCSWSTYKYCKGSSSTLTKYCVDSKGTVDNKTTLERIDDAACVNWGGTLRIPTEAEWKELYEQCTWTWVTQNNVNGYRVTGKNGNSIFLPAAGRRIGSQIEYGWYSVCYRSSSLYKGDSSHAYSFYFNASYYAVDTYSRAEGQPVRAVGR